MLTIFAVTVVIVGILFVREEILSAGAAEELKEQKRKAELCRRERLEWEKEWKMCSARFTLGEAKRPELSAGSELSERAKNGNCPPSP